MADPAQSANAPLPDNPALNITGAENGLNLSNTISDYQQQNLSPADVFSLSASIPQTLGGIPGLSMVPGLNKIPIPGVSQLTKALSPFNNARFGVSGNWTPNHYAEDLNNHFPKMKFLFKVAFYGFPRNGQDGAFYFYVHRCDKPKVRANHVDVNYYNFRTRVLTNVIYEPLSMSFLDETGDTVNEFFTRYLAQISGTGQGNYGIDRGWGPGSSTLPYGNGYTSTSNQRIILEQVFPMLKGKSSSWMANRFIFINPRIETFDFDELSHEDSSSGSMANITFSYDAILMDTVSDNTLYSWGQTDLMHAGGTSGPENAGSTAPAVLNDGKVVNKGSKATIYSTLQKGASALSSIPSALGGLVSPVLGGISSAIGLGAAPSSAISVVSSATQDTLDIVASGRGAPANPLPTPVKPINT